MRDDFSWQKIYPRAIRAEKDFDMLQAGDRILIGLSGGTDSLVLLYLLCFQHKKMGSRPGFTIFPAHIPGSYLGRSIASVKNLQTICRRFGLDLLLSSVGLSDSVFHDCFRCSQARRRLLFDLAEEQGCNKIALGHNADDLVETLLLNIFYSGRLSALSPRQSVLRGKLTLIRPLIYVWKSDIETFARNTFGRLSTPGCPGAGDSRRLAIRQLLAKLSIDNHHLKGNLLKAITNPRPEYLAVPTRHL